tara:strand:+ start:1671 stop:1811 length:141 start_codon:yes stop_codon:yes gene_type:complete
MELVSAQPLADIARMEFRKFGFQEPKHVYRFGEAGIDIALLGNCQG